MTRKEDRLERSRERAEAHGRRRRIRIVMISVAIFLWVFVPLLWEVAISFQLIHPVMSPAFASAAKLAGLALMLIIAEIWFNLLTDKDGKKAKSA